MFGWEWKSGGMEKVSLYKFTHIPLLKNDGQLKQKKVTNNHTHTHTKKKKKKKATCPPITQEIKKKKILKRTRHGHFCSLNSLIFSIQFSLHF